MIDQFTRQDFIELGQGGLAIDFQGVLLPFSLGEWKDLPPVPQRPAPFCIILLGPPQPLLAQGIYKVLHPRLGTLELFLVPIGRNNENARYELTFN